MAKELKSAEKMPKNAVKLMHMLVGVDFIKSKTTFAASRNTALEATAIGIKATSKSSGRIVVIPYSNVKGFELFPEVEEAPQEVDKK